MRSFRLDMTRDRDGFTSTARIRRLLTPSGILTRERNLPFAFVTSFDLPARVHRTEVVPLACSFSTLGFLGVSTVET